MATTLLEAARRLGIKTEAQDKTAPTALTPEQLEEGKKGYEKFIEDQKNNMPWYDKAQNAIEDVLSSIGIWAHTQMFGSVLNPWAHKEEKNKELPYAISPEKPSAGWSDEERNTFGYLYTQDANEAAKYAIRIYNKYNAEAQERLNKVSETTAKETPVLGSIASVALAPTQIVGMLGTARDYAISKKYGETVKSADYVSALNHQSTRGAIANQLNASGTLSDDLWAIGGKGWGDVYSLGMGIADSLFLGAGTMTGAGMLLNRATYFSRSATEGYNDAISRGLSPDTAGLYGVIIGAIECLTESTSDKLLANVGKDQAKGLLGEALRQAGQEGVEEFVSALVDALAQEGLFGENSDRQRLIKYYMSEFNMSHEEASKRALVDLAGEIVFAGLGGALAGGVSAGSVGGLKTAWNKSSVNPLNQTATKELAPIQDKLFESGKAIEDGTSRATIDKLSQKKESGKELSGYDLRKLHSAVTEGQETDTKNNVKLAIAERLKDKGVKIEDIPALTKIILSKALGENLTKVQQIKLKNNEIATAVSNEMDATNMLSGNFDSQWAIDAGINKIRDVSGVIQTALAEANKADVAEGSTTALNLSTEAREALRGKFTGLNSAYTPQSENTHIHTDEIKSTTLDAKQTAQIRAIERVANALGVDFYIYESEYSKKDGRKYVDKDGNVITDSGYYDPRDNSIHIDLHAGQNGEGTMLYTASHELVHWIKKSAADQFEALKDFVLGSLKKEGVQIETLIEKQIDKAKENGRDMDRDGAIEEIVADACMSVLSTDAGIKAVTNLKTENKGLWNALKRFFTQFFNRIDKMHKGVKVDSEEGQYLADMHETAKKLRDLFVEGASKAAETNTSETKVGDMAQVDASTDSVAPVMHSYRTWTESEYVTRKAATIERISESLGIPKTKVAKYINDINSIAKMIADDHARLDYEASSFGSAFVSNVEYGGSFDYTTLCKKRRIYTGTFSEIQKRLGDVALTPDDILEIRNLMIAEGIEATCGLCYVEGSRANMGKFAKEFIRLYKRDNPDAWIPTMVDVNTPDGVEQMRINHPDAYEQYEYFWNHYGKLKDSDPALFASQQKPKLYEARKEYKGEILKYFKGDMTVAKKNLNGGIRMQSFSDFEIVHLIDTMQVIMDMSTVGLAGQAYTKVPEFAQAFGGTGLKINLSLIAKGVDANGNLIFDDREGMPAKTAFELRDKYSENVGTIIVAFTDEQIFAAMADDRIDFIIPFHRSQWKKGQYGAMGLPQGTKDYTNVQNEKLIKPTYHEYRGRMVKDKATNYMPNEYWDFSKSGKENAEAYLEMCAKNNKRPKFYKFLDYDGNGKYSLKADGSTDGYWKLLIDFKMYDNNGVGSPQRPVLPDFNMDESIKMLNEYRGGHSSYPVANSVVDKFVESYNGKNEIKHSGRKKVDSSGNELSAEQQEFFKDSKARDKKGNLLVLYHGTTADFSTFKKGDVGFHFGTKGAARGRVGYGKNTILKEVYLNITNPIVFDEDLGSWDADYRLTRELYDMGILTQEDAESVLFTDDRQYRRTTEKANKKLAEVLLSKGYDGIAYENTFEGKKTSTSYIIFNSNQAKEIANKAPTSNPDIRYSGRKRYTEYDKPITVDDIAVLRSIGRKSINSFNADDIEKAQKWAHKFYKDLGVRSPFFRAWFGDWREFDDVSFAKIVDTKSDNRQPIKNVDTDWLIQASRQVHKETSHHSGKSQVTAVKYLPYIDDITQNAVLFNSEVSNDDNPNSLMYHTMYAYTEAMGYPALLKLQVEELFYYNREESGELMRDYILQNVEEESVSKRNRLSRPNHLGTNSSAISVADLFALVKQYDKDFSPKAANPLLLDETKQPRVFYHGTDAKFDEFSTDEIAAREGSFFFAENKEDAKAYGNNVYEVYLKAENLADYDNQPSEFYKLKTKREQVEWLKNKGYDGWYADIDSGGWGEFSVFSPEQIKSATSNIGTFDSSDRNIKHSARKRITPEMDASYLDAVNRGDTETAQRLVDDNAIIWGAEQDETGKPLHLYHGTSMFGFTEINVEDASDDSISFFATNNPEIAQGYMPWYEDEKSDLYHEDVRRIGKPEDRKHRGLSVNSKPEDVIKAVSKEFPEYKNARVATDKEVLDYLNAYWLPEAISAAEKLRAMDIPLASNNVRQKIYDMCNAVTTAAHKNSFSAWKDVAARYKEFDKIDIPFDASEMRPHLFYSHILGGIQQVSNFARTIPLWNDGSITNTAYLIDKYNSLLGGEAIGIYDLYAKSGKRLIVQGRGSLWNDIQLGSIEAEYRKWLGSRISEEEKITASTRDIAEFAKQNGYRSVVFYDIYDSGAYGNRGVISDVYAFFYPQEDVKSADPVTYDDNGNVIPLSERFNSEQSDIRYSSRKKRTVSTDSLPFVSDTAGMIVSDITEAYEATRKDKFESAVIASQIAFTNAQAGIEAIAKKYGVKNMEALVQAARVASHQAEEMIAGNQYRIGSDSKDYLGEGLQKIMQPIDEQGEDVKQAFFDYLFHQHNADRMSLERRSIEWNEEAKAELSKQTKRFASLDAEWNALKTEREKIARMRSKAAERNRLDLKLNELKREMVALNKTIRKLRKQVEEFVPLKNKAVLALNRDQIEARRAEILEQIAQLEAERKTLGRSKANASRVTEINSEIARLKEEEANLSAEVTEEQSREIIAKYEETYPGFIEVAEKIWKYNSNLNQYRVDTGLITQEAYDYMQKLYPHYVPSYRDGASTGIAAVKGKNNLAVSKTVKSATGSTKDLLNPIVIMARQTMETVRAGRINQIATTLFDAAGNDKTYLAEVSRKKVKASELVDLDPTELRPKGNQVTFYKDGKRVVMQVSSELFAGFDAFSPQMDIKNPLINGVKKVNDAFKRLVTSANPIFLLRNSIRDIQDAGINTKYPTRFLTNYARAVKMIEQNGELWNLYKAMGGSNQSYFDFDKGFKMAQTKKGFAKEIKPGENATKTQKIASGAKSLLAKMESANAYVELLPRFAEFISSIEAGNTAEQAMLDAADVTTNFARTGKVTKALNSTVIPFLNPAIQGASKAIRNVTNVKTFREGLILATKAAIVGIAPYLLNALLYHDDEDYELLRETDKENNHLIKFGDIFLKLPRGRMASVLAGLANRTGKTVSGEDADWMGYLKNASTQMNPFENMARTIFSPFLDVANNVTWYGSAIEGREFENKSPKDRYDENTSEIAIAIGKVINYSPKKIHYLIDQYSGVIGDFLLPATTKKAEKDFFSGNLTIDPVTSNKLSDSFYDIYYEAQYAKSADANNKTAEYQVKHLNRVKSAISKLFDEKSRIQSSDLSDREKLEQTRAIQVLINKAYKTAIDDYELITNAIEATSSVDDKYRYAEITRLVYGADAALEVYDEKVYAQSKVMKKAGISANVFYKYYFSTADIKSDKDKNGNTISGSKRKKTIQAIDKLKLPEEKRLILIASKGYALTENERSKLVRYINGLKLSATTKNALAELCGFEVKNGKIVNK